MGRIDFGRSPIVGLYDEDYIPAIVYPDELSCDPNTPDAEVRFEEDERAKHKSIYLDWHNHDGERNLELVCHYNSLRREFLNDAVKETSAVHGEIKTLTVTMARDNARVHLLFLQDLGFKRIADPNRHSWSFSCDIEEQRQRKKARKPRRRIVDVKEKPKEVVPELKPLLTVEQYRQKCAELDRLRALLGES